VRPPTPGELQQLGCAAAMPWPALLDGLNEAAWLVDGASLRVLAVNQAALQLLGQPREAVLGRPAAALIGTPEDQAFWDEVRAGRAQPLQSHTVLTRADGRTAHVLRRISALATGEPLYLVALQDQTEQRRMADAYETALAELQATLESTADGILVTDLAGRIRSFNRRFAQLWNLPEELLHANDDAAVFAWMAQSVVDAADYQRRLDALRATALQRSHDRLVLRSGRVLDRIAQPQWSRGVAIGRVYAFRDMSEQIAADERIARLSHTDALTGLANRGQLAHRVTHALAVARRDGQPFALLILDLDRFKHINDSLGHHLGDRVLRLVGERLRGCLREVDLVARMGGDQFALLLHEADAVGAETTARRLLEAAARPCLLDGAEFTVTCSIGIALCPADGMQIDDLMRHAETAMQRAKEGGRAGYRFQQAEQPVDLRARMRLHHAMRQGLASGHFRLHYQPQVNLRDERVVGAEALLRWSDPQRGDVPPADFIPVAEDSGFIVALGDWVLARAVQQAAQWQRRGRPMPVAVNVSALQFRQADFVERVAGALQQAGLPPPMLELELTESILVRDADDALARLQALARLGVRLAIDDFGTGYSSLAYLKRFPIDKLKIDRSFVQGLPADDSDAGIVQAIIQMARALGLRVIAEGVETEQQRRFLVHAGCDQCQGFLYAPALDSSSFQQRLSLSA